MQSHPAAQNTGTPLSPPGGTNSGKTLIEAFGDKIQVDDLAYYECVIAHRRGMTHRWVWNAATASYKKIILQDQDFEQ